jgi:glycosyltransferase involved in cell wall biosynthesis
MKIAQIAPLYESVPPQLYGGTERVVAWLCDELVALGHEVTLFASADSRTNAKLVPVRAKAIRLDEAPLKSEVAAHLAMLHEVRRQASRFDVLHFHLEMIHFPMFEPYAAKCVTTLHNRLDLEDLQAAYTYWRAFSLVSISEHQRLPLANANWLGTVGHGLPAALHRFCERPSGGYLAFVGRTSPEKGLETAIQLARKAGIPLKIAAKVERMDRPYFEDVVQPLLEHPLVEFIGEVGDEEKADFIGNARALLFPIRWPEPFGLVMIESMACGTPVVAFNHGAVPEVIQHGVSGFIAESEDEALAAIARLDRLDRHAVRAEFERRFTARAMASAYVEAYGRLTARPQLGLAS